MSALEDLAIALAGEKAQELIRAENPYYGFQSLPDTVSGLTLKTMAANPGVNTGQGLALGIGSGLLSGLLGVAGDRYQNTLMDRYQGAIKDSLLGNTPSSAGLTPNLFRAATNAGGVFKVQKKLALDELSDELNLRQEAESKNRLKDAVASNLAQRGQFDIDENGNVVRRGIVPIGGGSGSKADRMKQEAAELVAQGIPGGAAVDMVKSLHTGDRLEQQAAQKKIDEANKAAATFEELGNTIEAAVSGAGKTGPFIGNLTQLGDNISSLWSSGAGKELQYRQMLKEPALKQALALRQPGATSDKEMAMYLSASAGIGHTPETNLNIANKMKTIAALNRDYAEFLDYGIKEAGLTPNEAEAEWATYKAKYPLFVPGKDGEYVLNAKRPDWRSLIGKPIGNVAAPASIGASGSWDNAVPSKEDLIAEAKRRGLIK